MNGSFTRFVDFLLKSGEKRLTEVRSHINAKADYDYYADFRVAAAGVLRQNVQLALLPLWVEEKVDARKRVIYRELVENYARFAAGVQGWSEPTARDLSIGRGFSVHVNPELGVILGGQKTFVKLYCRKDPLTIPRADVTLGVMEEAFVGAASGPRLAVLDVRRNRLFSAHDRQSHVTKTRALVKADGAAYVALYSAMAATKAA